MGSKTFATIGRALPGRRNIVCTSRPQTIQVDGVEATSEQPAELLARLKKEGTPAVAICGGARIYHAFMATGLVDELYLTYVPIFFGTGVGLFADALDVKLQLLDTTPLAEGSILNHYAVQKA